MDAKHAGADQPGTEREGAPSKPKPPSLSIAVQIYIDKDMTAEQVDHVFASMARHLYDRE